MNKMMEKPTAARMQLETELGKFVNLIDGSLRPLIDTPKRTRGRLSEDWPPSKGKILPMDVWVFLNLSDTLKEQLKASSSSISMNSDKWKRELDGLLQVPEYSTGKPATALKKLLTSAETLQQLAGEAAAEEDKANGKPTMPQRSISALR